MPLELMERWLVLKIVLHSDLYTLLIVCKYPWVQKYPRVQKYPNIFNAILFDRSSAFDCLYICVFWFYLIVCFNFGLSLLHPSNGIERCIYKAVWTHVRLWWSVCPSRNVTGHNWLKLEAPRSPLSHTCTLTKQTSSANFRPNRQRSWPSLQGQIFELNKLRSSFVIISQRVTEQTLPSPIHRKSHVGFRLA